MTIWLSELALGIFRDVVKISRSFMSDTVLKAENKAYKRYVKAR